MLSQTQKSIAIQKIFLLNTLDALFGKHQSFSLEILQIIQAFLFSSPFKPKNAFILKQGILLLKLDINPCQKKQSNFILNHQNQQIIIARSKVVLKQGDQLMVGNKHYLNEKIKISKIWNKPQTRTQKKILTYCPKFKQFMLGKHHNTKMIDQRYLKRDFLVLHHEKDMFDKYLKDVQLNDPYFCSPEVLDSFMALITINYIEIEVQSSEFNDRNEKIYKIVPEGGDSQIFNGIKLVFNAQLKRWDLVGQNLVIWKQKKVFSRKQTLVRTVDGKMDLIEGDSYKNISEFQFIFSEQE